MIPSPRTCLRHTAFLLALAISSWAAEPASPADAAWTHLQQTLYGSGEHAPANASPGDRFVAIFGNVAGYLKEADQFIHDYPSDPRRWGAFLDMKDFYEASLNMLEQQDAATRTRIDAILSAGARADWTKRIAELQRQFLAATDVPPALRYRWDVAPWFNAMFDLMKQNLPEDSAQWASLRAGLDQLAGKYADLKETAELVKHYSSARFASGKDTPTYRAELESLARSSNRFVQAAARERLHFLDLSREPLDLAFTAADGRKVDLKDLRGKVVLIDFWATWCVPCIEEIPNVKRAYANYHDRGFEVIGISLENARLSPKDTEEQAAAKLAAARGHLLEFVDQHAMPWPQYFDGKWWKNDVARRYAVDAIPAMFLLDQDGRIISTNARGPKLEQEITRLLKL